MSTLERRLRALGSYDDLASFAARFGDDADAFVEQCPRGDWLLAIAARLELDRGALVRAAVACAREALGYLAAPATALDEALAAAQAWSHGRASAEACAEQQQKLVALPASQDAVEDAVMQACVAALSVINEPASAAFVAACAAQTAVLAAGDCALEAALRFTHERCAKLARAELGAALSAALRS